MKEAITYISEIICALESLDGMGTLTEVNSIIEERNILPYIHTNKNWKDNIRATIQRHCSQTKSYRGATNLFYSVYGLGEGVWGLLGYTNNYVNNELTPFENRQVENVLTNENIAQTEKETIILARKGQGQFRKNVLNKFEKCIITNIKNPVLLIASHIKPWRSSSNIERLSPENGLALSPLYDKLFDLGYISFDKNTKVLISQEISEHDIKIINLDKNRIYIPNCSSEMKLNLEYHNDVIFRH